MATNVAPTDVGTRRRSLDVRSASYARGLAAAGAGDVEGGGASAKNGIQRSTTEFGNVSGGMDVAVKVSTHGWHEVWLGYACVCVGGG